MDCFEPVSSENSSGIIIYNNHFASSQFPIRRYFRPSWEFPLSQENNFSCWQQSFKNSELSGSKLKTLKEQQVHCIRGCSFECQSCIPRPSSQQIFDEIFIQNSQAGVRYFSCLLDFVSRNQTQYFSYKLENGTFSSKNVYEIRNLYENLSVVPAHNRYWSDARSNFKTEAPK